MTKWSQSASEYSHLQREYVRYRRRNPQLQATNNGSTFPNNQPLPAVKSTPVAKDICSLPENEQTEPRSENTSLSFFIARIILGAWKPFKETPPRTRCVCVVLFILTQCALSIVLVALLSALLNWLNLIYLVLATITSYNALIVWMEAQNKSNKHTPN